MNGEQRRKVLKYLRVPWSTLKYLRVKLPKNPMCWSGQLSVSQAAQGEANSQGACLVSMVNEDIFREFRQSLLSAFACIFAKLLLDEGMVFSGIV